jgi:hypothetical protein
MRLLVTLLFILLVMACGKDHPSDVDSNAEALTAVELDHAWMLGEWHLQGTPTSYSDLGADVRHMHIAKNEIWLETFGHLAAESSLFNTDGFDYGGNCLYRAHGSRFGFKGQSNSVVKVFALYRDSFELLDDPGNRADCATQIKRINEVIHRQQSAREIGEITHGDDDSLKLAPRFMLTQSGELKRYLKQ